MSWVVRRGANPTALALDPQNEPTHNQDHERRMVDNSNNCVRNDLVQASPNHTYLYSSREVGKAVYGRSVSARERRVARDLVSSAVDRGRQCMSKPVALAAFAKYAAQIAQAGVERRSVK